MPWLTCGVYYGGLSVLLVLVITGALGSLLPGALASTVAYNSEAYFFAVVVAAWIHLRTGRQQTGRWWPVITVSAASAALCGVFFLMVELPPRISTLNESAFAAAFAIVYIGLPRPLPRAVPWLISGVLVVVAVFGIAAGDNSWVIQQAEAVGFLVLLPLALDVVDRGILHTNAVTSVTVRYAWYLFLVVEPVVVSVLGTTVRQGDSPLALTLEFLGRIHESFFGVALICVFFAVALRRSGSSRPLPV